MSFVKLLVLIFFLAIGAGIAYVSFVDVPLHQQPVTKTIANEGVLNAE